MYAIWIDCNPGSTRLSDISDFAFTRVDAGTARPPAPLLSLTRGAPAAHSLDVPYKGTFAVSYDVSNVPGASGAMIEIAAPPPGPFFYDSILGVGFNTFRNPNGNALDDDGVVTGSIYHQAVGGTVGSVAIDPSAAGIPVTTTVNVRVIPTNGNSPVAEASDISTVQYHGLAGNLGVALGGLYMNPSGTDGYLSESSDVGSLQTNIAVYTIEPFDLRTGTVASSALTSTTASFALYPILQNDAGFSSAAVDPTVPAYYHAVPFSSGFTSFTFPPGSFAPTTWALVAAANSTPTRSAFVGIDLVSGAFVASRGDVAAGSGFSSPVDFTALLPASFDSSALFTFAYDAGSDRGYLLSEDASLDCTGQSPQLVTIDFAAGSATSRPLTVSGGTTGGGGYQMAIDSVTHVAAVATTCQNRSTNSFEAALDLIDLTTGATREVFRHTLTSDHVVHGFAALPGGDSPIIGIDTVNHLVLQASIFCPTEMVLFDLDGRPCLNEYDESGHLVKTIPGLLPDGSYTEFFSGVNGTLRTGVALGQQSSTSIFIDSTEVQPLTY
ncbi:MAG: hypothetical protein JO225_16795 [Candidatus Eremiobacteraeota bacterium]|nr:hypothetical protein [Candidatus Eremiobacteraeota bacterium]